MDKQIDLFKTFLYNYTDFIGINKNKNTFIYDSNEPLKAGVIPDGTTELILGDSFNQPLKEGFIPNSVTYLIFSQWFDRPLEKGTIPDGVTHLIFGDYFNQPLKEGVIPNSVTHIIFTRWFNQPLEKGVIPNGTTHLIFGPSFNQPLNNIVFKNIISLILYKDYPYKNSLNDNNKLIYYYDNNKLITYGNIKISLNDMIKINKYIDKNLKEDKLIGRVIFKELTEKVLHPSRLMKICNEYNISFHDLISNYIKN